MKKEQNKMQNLTQKENIIVEIVQDDTLINPREWDNLGKIICFHKRYDLGDKTELKSDQFFSWNSLKEHLIKEEKAIILAELFLYDHSGLRIKIGSFNGLLSQGHAEFDSGQVGFIYTTKNRIKERFCIKKITKKHLDDARAILENEIKTYDDYLSGNVWAYNITKTNICKECKHKHQEIIDSCGGFYGSNKESGILESIPKEYHKYIKEVNNDTKQKKL